MHGERKKSTSFVRRISDFKAPPTPAETKRSKLGVAGGPRKVDFVFLMEKYGARKKQVVEDTEDGQEEPPEDPGFVIKFRLSSAYKAMEKQEIEASVPLMRPYRVKKHRSVTKSTERPEQMTEGIKSPRNSIDEGSVGNSVSSKSAISQARMKFQHHTSQKPSWTKFTQTKALPETQTKEKERRRSMTSVKSKDLTLNSTRNESIRQSSPEVRIFQTPKDKNGKDGVKFIDEVGLTTAEKFRNRMERDKKVQTRNYIPTSRMVRKLMKHGFGSNLLPDVATDSDYDDTRSTISSSRFDSGLSSSSSMSSDIAGTNSTNQRRARISSANGKRTSVLSQSFTCEEEGRRHRKANKYLYQMCNCRNIAKPDTMNTLFRRRNNLSGVIQIYGCPKEVTDSTVVCPFCNIFPKSHICAWLEDIDSDEEPF